MSLDAAHKRLHCLIDISHLLMAAADPDQVLELILDSGRRLLEADDCSMALLDEAGDQLVFFAMSGGSNLAEFRIGADEGFAGWVLQHGQSVLTNDVAHDQRFLQKVDDSSGYKTRQLMAAPIVHHGQLIGVIEALNTPKPGGFLPEDLELLEAFGGLAGAALTRARVESAIRNAGAIYREDIQGRFQLVAGRSQRMREALELARRVARTRSTVLLLGESGTGKEVFARAIHQWSDRAAGPFVAVNCVALTPTLLESELFGHDKGAFTGATAMKRGRFELAEGGTLFLDEIGDLAPGLQTKLLRVLQEREFQRVGGDRDIRADVRVLAATNRDLRRDMQAGRFREDLFYRLNVFTVRMPRLTDRREDIPDLARHFAERSALEVARPPMGITPDAMEALSTYPWPGNIRELSNVIERAVVLAPGPDIELSDLPRELVDRSARLPTSPQRGPTTAVHVDPALPLSEAVREFKRARIQDALARTRGNQRAAAELLGVAQSNLSRALKTLGLR